MAIATPNLEELIGQRTAGLGIGDDLLKLLVERLVAFSPVDGIVEPHDVAHDDERRGRDAGRTLLDVLQRAGDGALLRGGRLRDDRDRPRFWRAMLAKLAHDDGEVRHAHQEHDRA